MTLAELLVLAALSDLKKRTARELRRKVSPYLSDSSLLWPAVTFLTNRQLLSVDSREDEHGRKEILYSARPEGIREFEKQRALVLEALRKL